MTYQSRVRRANAEAKRLATPITVTPARGKRVPNPLVTAPARGVDTRSFNEVRDRQTTSIKNKSGEVFVKKNVGRVKQLRLKDKT